MSEAWVWRRRRWRCLCCFLSRSSACRRRCSSRETDARRARASACGNRKRRSTVLAAHRHARLAIRRGCTRPRSRRHAPHAAPFLVVSHPSAKRAAAGRSKRAVARHTKREASGANKYSPGSRSTASNTLLRCAGGYLRACWASFCGRVLFLAFFLVDMPCVRACVRRVTEAASAHCSQGPSRPAAPLRLRFGGKTKPAFPTF